MKKTLQRIMKKDMINCENLDGIYVNFNENDITKANAIIIGPKNTVYENGFLLFNIYFPNNYPYVPPIVEYVSFSNIRIHPNLYKNGKVCLSLLGTWPGPSWTSIMDISSILLSIQSLLTDNPLRNEPGYETIDGEINDNYNEIIKYNTIDSLILNTYTGLPPDFLFFKEKLKDYFIKNLDQIKNQINKNIETNLLVNVNIYRIKKIINYKKLLEKFNQIIVDEKLFK